jgi:structural maintenance of chromosome 4
MILNFELAEDQERASPDLGVLKEYAQREAEFMARAADLEATTRARDEAKQLLEDLNQQRLEEFMWGFQIISGKLKEMYQVRPFFVWCTNSVQDYRFN